MKRTTGVVLLAVCAAIPTTHAGDMFGGTDDEAGGDIPVVLSATRLRQSLADTPASVTIIDRQMIEQTGVREIPELLRLVPGMVVGYESSSEAFVSQHGTSADLARRMQVLVDGRSVYQPLLASVDWVGLPLELDDIERIEVTRGPNSAAYGVNSFLGVVNIITRHPADSVGGDASAIVGENGIEDHRVRLGRRTGEVDWRLTASTRSDDGYSYNLRQGGSDYSDSKDVDSVYGRMVWSPGSDNVIDISFGLARMDAQQQYRKAIYIEPPLAERENRYLALSWESELDARNRVRIQLSHSEFERHEAWLVDLPPIVFRPALVSLYDQNRTCANAVLTGKATGCKASDMPLIAALQGEMAADPALTQNMPFLSLHDVREARTELEINDTILFSPTLRTVVGLTVDHAGIRSRTYLNGDVSNDVYGAFAHAEWRFLPDWLLNIGGSLEDDQVADRYFTPRYALNWRFLPEQTLRLIYSEAIRTPDVLETQAYWQYRAQAVDRSKAAYDGVFYQRGIAGGVAPTERIDSREVGYFGRFNGLRLTADIRVFRDILWLAEHDLQIDSFNIAPNLKYVMEGAEAALEWRPHPVHRVQLNYAYLNSSADETQDNGDFVPLHSGSAAWWLDGGGNWQIGSTYYFYNDLRSDRFRWERLDLQLTRKIALPGGQSLDVSAALQRRLSNDPELRSENGSVRHRGWLELNYHFN